MKRCYCKQNALGLESDPISPVTFGDGLCKANSRGHLNRTLCVYSHRLQKATGNISAQPRNVERRQ